MTPLKERVIPFVEDRRNCLLLEPALDSVDADQRDQAMASLQAALKNAIQVRLPARGRTSWPPSPCPPPTTAAPSCSTRPRKVAPACCAAWSKNPARSPARRPRGPRPLPLRPRHRRGPPPRAPACEEDCEAACYDCLMSYSNQRDHRLLDRHLIRDWLLALPRRRGQDLAHRQSAGRAPPAPAQPQRLGARAALATLPRRAAASACPPPPSASSSPARPGPTSSTRTPTPSSTSTAHPTTTRSASSATPIRPTAWRTTAGR